MDDRSGGLLVHGIAAPSISGGTNAAPRVQEVVENPNASYVLQVEGIDVSQSHPEIDWSRHLPPEVILDRREHDKYVLRPAVNKTEPLLQNPRLVFQILHDVVSPRSPFALSSRYVSCFECSALTGTSTNTALLPHATQRHIMSIISFLR